MSWHKQNYLPLVLVNMAATQQPGIEQFANEDADKLLILARITETAERFEDMCTIMGKLVVKKKQESKDLEVEERNMLSVAYKNVVGQRRASWRTLKAEEEAGEGTPEHKDARSKYKGVVETELQNKCLEVLTLLEENLIQEAPEFVPDENDHTKTETQVFYLKMCGDYYRYLAEFSDQENYKVEAGAKYEKAMDLAKGHLAPTHPTRLGLALNASVCYYEIMKEAEKACKLAKEAFDEAIQKLDSLSDSTYKDSTLIMQLLRDNLTIWTSESQDNANVEEHED